MRSGKDEEPPGVAGQEEDRGGAGLYARLMVIGSSPLFRFAFRAAIPIALVIVVAIIVGSH